MKKIIITLVFASLMPLGMANAAGPATPQKVFDMVIMAVQAMEGHGSPGDH
ncbi:MAG: hypothetical protein GY859_11065 [Desulfobacterales bacterium]|nr:hypothetical protein [Desulfobacterales bacterium]